MRCLGLILIASAIVACAPVETGSPPFTDGASLLAGSAAPTAQAPPPAHVIGVRQGVDGAELFDRRTGDRFVIRGVNYTRRVSSEAGLENRVFAVGVWDPVQFDADLAALAEPGYNTVRLWLDSCSRGPDCLTPEGTIGLNGAYLDNIAEGIEIAKARGMLLLLTSNDIPDGGGYGSQANSGSGGQFAGYRNAHFLSGPGVAAATRYWHDILTGLLERGAPTDAVLAWELVNEQWVFEDQPPLSLRSGSVTTANGESYDMASETARRQMVADNVTFYIEQVAGAVRELDPTSLVTVGFFHPKFPNPARAGDTWYVDTASLLDRAPVDFFDFHAYPGVELSIEQYAENFGMIGYTAKPVVMGEVGAFTFAYGSADDALVAIARWIADSCPLGWDGWLYWEFNRPPVADDATWGFTDDGNRLMDALAPKAQPNPCDASAIAPVDLAHGQPVTASAALADQPGAHAVDGNVSTIWLSGGGPPQWIEVQLPAGAVVGQVALLVAQDPAGDTHHRVLGRLADGSYTVLGELDGETKDNTWLRVTGGPWNGLTAIRVETSQSPSWVAWREIQVFGP